MNKSSGDAKGARKPTKKLMMAETKPSPMGRRIQPVIDAAMRAKVEAAAAKKRKDQVCYLHLSNMGIDKTRSVICI